MVLIWLSCKCKTCSFLPDNVISDVILDPDTRSKTAQHPECYVLGQKCLPCGVASLAVVGNRSQSSTAVLKLLHCVLPEPFEGMSEQLYYIRKLLGTLFFTQLHVQFYFTETKIVQLTKISMSNTTMKQKFNNSENSHTQTRHKIH